MPGPAQPLYLCGAHLSYFSAIMPIADGMGLVFAVTSYDGQVVISPTSCRELMPDPELFAQCVRDSFQEYLAAALVSPGLASRPKPSPKPAAARKPRQAVKPAAPKAALAARAAPRRASRAGRPTPTSRMA